MRDRDIWSAPRSRSDVLDVIGLVLLAAAVRLALLPLASQDTNDHSLRLWIAQRLSEDPFLLLHGHWPPLHFYLLAPVIGGTDLLSVDVHRVLEDCDHQAALAIVFTTTANPIEVLRRKQCIRCKQPSHPIFVVFFTIFHVLCPS